MGQALGIKVAPRKVKGSVRHPQADRRSVAQVIEIRPTAMQPPSVQRGQTLHIAFPRGQKIEIGWAGRCG